MIFFLFPSNVLDWIIIVINIQDKLLCLPWMVDYLREKAWLVHASKTLLFEICIYIYIYIFLLPRESNEYIYEEQQRK